MLFWDFFYIKRFQYITFNKTNPAICHNKSLLVKKFEKWDIFKFSDFDRISAIFQFYSSSIEINTNIAIDFCTCILELC